MKTFKLLAAIGMAVAVTLTVSTNAQTTTTDGSGGDCVGTIPGCGCRTNGFSPTTGQPCIGNVPLPSLPTNVTNVPATDQTITVEAVRESFWMFQSKPAFMSWAVRRVADQGNLGLDFKSPVMIASGGYGWYMQYNSSSPSIDEMNNLVSSNEVLFPIAREGAVTVTVTYRDKNWVTLFEGSSVKYANLDYSQTQPPVDGKMLWSLYGSDPVVTIAKNIHIVLKGVRYLQIFPENGGEPTWLFADRDGGFDIPRSVIGSGAVIVAVDNSGNGNHITFNLRTDEVRKSGNVHGRIRPTMEGALILTNATSIVIKPEAQYGQGSDIMAEVTYTHNMSRVRLVVRTSEGETAQKVYIVNVATGDYDEYPINWNEDIELDFQIGRYHIVPVWWNFKDSTFLLPYDGNGGGVSSSPTPITPVIEEK